MDSSSIDIGLMAYPLGHAPSKKKLRGLMVNNTRKIINQQIQGLTQQQITRLRKLVVEVLFDIIIKDKNVLRQKLKMIVEKIIQELEIDK